MKQNLTDITVILDRSGSMSSVKNDTIGGFNQFLADQKALPGEATITLAQFDDQFEFVYKSRNIKDAPQLTDATFVPRGWTALLDAIGFCVNDTGARLSNMAENDRPEKVVFLILTDGQENKSREFTKAKINEMITHQRDTYKWQFLFVGANQDAIATGADIGIEAAASMTFSATPAGTQTAFASLSSATASYRSAPSSRAVSFSDEDRRKQKLA